MAGQCCVGGAASRRLARRISRAAASVLPGTALVLLPKCPLCLAAWLTAATGIGFSAAGAKWASATLVVFWIAALLLVAIPIVRRFSTSFRSLLPRNTFLIHASGGLITNAIITMIRSSPITTKTTTSLSDYSLFCIASTAIRGEDFYHTRVACLTLNTAAGAPPKPAALKERTASVYRADTDRPK